MKIAIPLADGRLGTHFGHCSSFAIIQFDSEANKIAQRMDVEAPPHQPGVLPAWLAEQGINLVIAGGMGQRALDLLTQHGISVLIGAFSEIPEKLVEDYMAGRLQTGENPCDH